MSHDARIKELGLDLPPPPPPAGVYKPMVIDGRHAYLSGHGPLLNDGTYQLGRVGEDLDLDGGKAAARVVGLALLATLRENLGTLDRVVRVIKVLGMVNCTPDFKEHPQVINGCSELFAEVFGTDDGVGVRSAVGMGSLPGNIPVEVEALFEDPGVAMPWYAVKNHAEIPSPALLIWPERIRANIRQAVGIAGHLENLRPHVKTHKMAEVIGLQLEAGIEKFKCATIAEAEMTAAAGAADVVLAIQPVGPQIDRLLELAAAFPDCRFSAVVDDAVIIDRLSDAADEAGLKLGAWLDLDCGMHRSGIAPGPEALILYRHICQRPGLVARGLHVYDGHLRSSDPIARQSAHDEAMAPLRAMKQELEREGLEVPAIAGGGTPTFPCHSRAGDTECGPGTTVLWDFGYGDAYPELGMQHAALLLTRVISKPGKDRLCLDLGTKAVASEMEPPRVRFMEHEECAFGVQSEEHLVVETPYADRMTVGDVLYGIPRHICPTVALHMEAVVIEDGQAVDRWKIAARDRRIHI